MAKRGHIDLELLLDHFADLEDPRADINQRHPLPSVIVIAVLGILSNCNGPTAIALWAKNRAAFLTERLDLPNGVPRKDVFRRVLSLLDPAAFQSCFIAWLQDLRAAAQAELGDVRPIFAVDGKTARRSHDRKNGLGPLHSVSVWATELGIALAQLAVGDDSNEIAAIPKLLELVDIKDVIVTIDAIGAQTKIANQVIEQGGDYLLRLKMNQPTDHQFVKDYVERGLESDFAGVKLREHTTEETSHGRTETRTYIQIPAPKNMPGRDKWRGLETIGVVLSTTLRDGVESCETRYYLSSLKLNVKQFARAARGHWGIENGCHWVLDMAYREDESRARNIKMRQNLAWLNRFTLSLLRQHSGNMSLVMKRRCCGWSDDFLMEVLAGKGT